MNPVLYLIMRNDIPSMNPGKLAAQAAHVANAFEFEFNKSSQAKKHLGKLYKEWKNQTKQGFGTTICLGANEDQFLFQGRNLRNDYNYLNGSFSGEVYDPTYPCEIPLEVAKYLDQFEMNNKYTFMNQIVLKEGSAIFLRNELVGMYVFGDKDNEEVKFLTEDLELYP